MKLKAIIAATAVAFSSSAFALDVPGPVVDTEWLAQHLGDKDLVVIDIRHPVKSAFAQPVFTKDKKSGKEVLAKPGGHIPGATVVDSKKIRAKREIDGKTVEKVIPAKADFEQLVQSWGIDADDAIVIVPMGYGNGEITGATRLYWQLKYYGADNMAILNGGTTKWLAEHREYSTRQEAPAKGNWAATAQRDEILATTDEAKQAAGKGVQIVDNRAPTQYMGIYTKSYVYDDGHIGGAKNMPVELVSEVGSGSQFLSAGEYRNMLTNLGIDADKPAITVCNSGHVASGGWFIMHELLGNKNVQLYDGSMHEWTLRGNKASSIKGS